LPFKNAVVEGSLDCVMDQTSCKLFLMYDRYFTSS